MFRSYRHVSMVVPRASNHSKSPKHSQASCGVDKYLMLWKQDCGVSQCCVVRYTNTSEMPKFLITFSESMEKRIYRNQAPQNVHAQSSTVRGEDVHFAVH